MSIISRKAKLAGAGMIVSASLIASVSMAAALDDAIKTQQGTDKASAASQSRVNRLDDQAVELLDEYKQVIRQVESLRTYNDQVQRMVANQQKEIDSLNAQIDSIEQTNIEITPLMLKMVDALDAFIKLDLPFQEQERAHRISSLQAAMDNPNVTTSEKYRKILEAYQIETEFGRNIEAYKASLGSGDQTRTYNFLRIGRVALMYQSLDGKETGFWNKQAGKFEVLPDSYRGAVNQGLKIARKQAPPALIKLPVPAAVNASK